MKAGILSVPVDLVVSSPSSNCCIPLVVMSKGVMVGKGLFGIFGIWLSSCVYTDWIVR